MKMKSLIATLGITLTLGVGTLVGLNTINHKETKEAEAATATTVYYAVDTSYTVKCNVNRKGDGDDWAKYTMTKVSGAEGIYKATFTDLYNGLGCLQFQLYDGDTWKSQVQPISSWTWVSTYNNKLYYNGAWVTSFKEVKKTTTLSSSTGRVFFYNSGTHWASEGTCAVYAWGGDATKSIDSTISMEGTFYHFSWFQDDNNEYYGYADIPTNITGYKIAKLNNSNYVTTLSYDSTTSLVVDSFAYVRYGLSEGNGINTGGAHDDTAGANLMKKVLEAYNTCSSSVLNGYGAYSALNESFYSHATAAAKSATVKTLGGSTNYTVQTHMEAMAARSAGGSSTNALLALTISNNGVSTIIIVISSVSLLSLGLFFLLKRKKEN